MPISKIQNPSSYSIKVLKGCTCTLRIVCVQKPRSRNPKVERPPTSVFRLCSILIHFEVYTDESEFAFCLVVETSSLCWSFIKKEFRKVCGVLSKIVSPCVANKRKTPSYMIDFCVLCKFLIELTFVVDLDVLEGLAYSRQSCTYVIHMWLCCK